MLLARAASRNLRITALAKGCDAGAVIACSNLGVAYERGIGVARDPDRAHALYEQACSGGWQGACAHLPAP